MCYHLSLQVILSVGLISLPLLAHGAEGAGSTAEIQVDCGRVLGEIRPLHGGNSGPIQYGETVDLSAYHRELGIPFIRLHDCHWPNPDVVDIHAVFPDFKADPSRPESYDFRRTDDYIQAIVNAGSQIVYRLGESIEHTKRKYYVHPPADYEKWAAVCVGIIRHYNEGWAAGFRHDIRYWEIWNEPENRPAMWSGSDEDYFRLYATAAKAIKPRFPGVKVGGPSLGYTGKITGGVFEPSPFLAQFLEYCRARSLPLDFFSWHLYTADPHECVVRAQGIRAVLDRHGFAKTESHFNEWNYLPGNDWMPMLQGQGLPREKFYEQIGGAPGAAFAAGALLFLQDSPVDVANYYTAETSGFGLFTVNGVPRKNFYAFKAFRRLLDTPVRLAATGNQPGRLAVCAGTNRDRSEVGVLISNFNAAEARLELKVNNLPWTGPVLGEIFIVDATRDLVKVREVKLPAEECKLSGELKAPAVCFLKLTRAAGEE